MAEGKIVRKGGAGKQTLAPTITEVSKTSTSITFTLTNNDDSTATIIWEVGDTTPDENSIELAAGATSSNITISGLSSGTNYTIYTWATVIGKIQSELVSQTIQTFQIYTAATGGTTLEYDSGGKRYRSHIFESNGTFTVTTVGGDPTLNYLIVAGGGSGGNRSTGGSWIGAGGGGAGGFRTTLGTQGGLGVLDTPINASLGNFSITVGAGAAGQASSNVPGTGGSNSAAFGRTASGGGGGGAYTLGPTSGGSGGGGSSLGSYSNQPPTLGAAGTANQGFAGGNGHWNGSTNYAYGGGGGGGAGEVGESYLGGKNGKKGGNGLSTSLIDEATATSLSVGEIDSGLVYFSGGGGGDGYIGVGAGGLGGGAAGRSSAVANTGGGGGGRTYTGTSGAGGSGIVIIQYEILPT